MLSPPKLWLSPVVIKHLGESLSGDMDSWITAAPDVMEKDLMLKFSQNDDLLTRMIERIQDIRGVQQIRQILGGRISN